MKRVTILAMQNTIAFTVISPMDVFTQAGVMWNHFNGRESTPYFDVNLVTTVGKPFKCLNGLRIVPNGSIHDVKEADLIVVTSILDIQRTLRLQYEAVDWLRELYQKGAHIATICSGAFVLAETGLLNGKTATTHWGFADQFKRRYPQIRLKPDRMITDEGDLFCSGGYGAAMDLSLYLVEKYCGHEVAVQSSKSLVSDMNRLLQTPYAAFQFRKDHGNDKILKVQEWIERNFDRNFSYEELARKNGMSRRTLERQFKAATGETPLTYQQSIRVESAKRMLEEGIHSFDEITYRVGYEDHSTFRKIFVRQTGLVPKEYRKKFQRVRVG
ncbi:MAG: GlxA family transcriptional regulator [Desulfobacteraceae bacterium]|jgi:transcriptional regulator GlxA family with amidase domain|nr:MAG: GlxA family transcriptional regulator [Desulfobacteraceae bacterium]